MKKNASYQEVMETAKRMHERYSCKPSCGDCPLGNSNIAHCRKVAFENPDMFAELVMKWGETHQIGVNEFSIHQERQIDEVLEAAERLVRVLVAKPIYLLGTQLRGFNDPRLSDDIFLRSAASEIADVAADLLARKNVNVFFPIHIEESSGVYTSGIQHVRDTYNDPICNE